MDLLPCFHDFHSTRHRYSALDTVNYFKLLFHHNYRRSTCHLPTANKLLQCLAVGNHAAAAKPTSGLIPWQTTPDDRQNIDQDEQEATAITN